MTKALRGYGHPAYAASLAQFGSPTRLPLSEGSLLRRPITGTSAYDVMGPYPLFTCANWSSLGDDLDNLATSAVSAMAVLDPMAVVGQEHLRRAFPDRLVRLKDHFIRDLDRAGELSGHHRRNVGRALRSVEVERCADPQQYLDDWLALYSNLVRRHGLSGMRAFSREAFAAQFAVPGLLVWRAIRHTETVAMSLWFEAGPVAYYHLGASNSLGYEVGASYGLFHHAFEHLRERGVRHVDIGGVPQAGSEGLQRFKSGWATERRDAWLGGRILDADAYERLSCGRTGWFPAYRHGEPDFVGVATEAAAHP